MKKKNIKSKEEKLIKNFDYNNYINKNKFGQECQVVTAINAYMKLTGKVIQQKSKKYDLLVNLAKAKYGTAICVEKVWEKLNIYPASYSRYLLHPEMFNSTYSLPMEITVDTKYGLHSMCAVDYEPKTHSFRIPNWKWYTSTRGWVFIEDLKQYICDRDGWCCRVFKLIN